MSKEIKILIGIVAVVAVSFFVARQFYNKKSTDQIIAARGITLRQEFVREDSWTLGPKDAPVTIVEFLDPECESCKAFFPTMKSILKKHEGKVHFVVRYMAFHKSSQMAVAATEAAGLQNKYWEMQELLFNRTEEWSHQPAPRREFFQKYASELGLGMDRFDLDLDDPKWVEKVKRDMADGKFVGVQSTPTIFVNGVLLADLSYEALDEAINKVIML